MAATYTRESHAAHTGNGTGWDLESWDVLDSDMGTALTLPTSVPEDARYSHGYVDRVGAQHWIYVRRAPMSSNRCPRCDA